MTQPEGCVIPGQKDKVWKLSKSLYGLKQAPKQWYDKFNYALFDDGSSYSDCVIIYLYVDDMLIFDTCIDSSQD